LSLLAGSEAMTANRKRSPAGEAAAHIGILAFPLAGAEVL